MARCYATSVQHTSKGVVIHFQQVDANALAQDVSSFFSVHLYRLESGTPLNGVWGAGSAVRRLLFGGFAKRNKFRITFQQNGDFQALAFDKAMTGWIGGLHSVLRTSQETKKLVGQLHSYFLPFPHQLPTE